MSSGRTLPAVLRTDTFERPVNQDVNTDVLRPVQFNQKTCRFVFDRKGVLDANSQLNLKLIVENSGAVGVETLSTFPASTGVLSLIKRAFLTIGGRRVSNLEEVGQYNTWKRLHWSNAYRKGIAIPKQGGNDIFVGSASKTIDANNDVSIQARGFQSPYGVLGRESSEYAIDDINDADFGTQDTLFTSETDAVNRLIGLTAKKSPSFVVGLQQLVPFLVGVQLPLFAIREEVALNIEWTDDVVGKRYIPSLTDEAGTAINTALLSSTIIEADCFIMADYLFYPDQMTELADEIMNRGGYDVPYLEVYTQQNFTQYAGADTLNTNTYQIAMGGKNVKHIIIQKQVDSAVQNDGYYNSRGFKSGEAYQLNIDSQNFYSRPVSNIGLQKTEADQVEGIPLQMCNYRYTWDNQNDAGVVGLDSYGLTDRLYNSHSQQLECGNQHFLGVKLENSFGIGKRLSNLPMTYTEQIVFRGSDEPTRTIRFFVGTQRVLNISQGIVNMIE